MSRQEYFDKAFDKALWAGLIPTSALKVAKEATDTYTPKVTGKKSFTAMSSVGAGYSRDILIGYPELDIEAMNGGKALSNEGWSNLPKESIKVDINHFMYDAMDGVPNDLDEESQKFTGVLKDFYTTSQGMRGILEFPENEVGKKTLDKYDAGELGFSVEYEGYDHKGTVKDWNITGGSLHTDPSYDKTKPAPTKSKGL